jgi:hypothetical protein
MTEGTRVYIDAKPDGSGRWVAFSSPTAATVRRDGTVTEVKGDVVAIRFDDAPERTSRVQVQYVRTEN